VIDPRTTNIVGTHVQIVKRIDPSNIQGRGVVRVVDYNQGAFMLLIEAVGIIGDGTWVDGELFQVSLFDESIAVIVEKRMLETIAPSGKESPISDEAH